MKQFGERLGGWVEEMLAMLASRPQTAPAAPVPREGSLWLSISTKRRASVLWANHRHVRLSFSEHASVTLTIDQLTRLYTPIL